jgi:hypothetical protein
VESFAMIYLGNKIVPKSQKSLKIKGTMCPGARDKK